MATTQPNLSETAKVQIPQRAQPLHAVPFLRPHSCSEEPARPESHSEPRDVNGCDFTPISISILRMKELSEHIQKPSGLVFTFIRGISPGESGHTSTGTDYQHFVQNFLFSPPTKSVPEFMRPNAGCTQWPFWAASSNAEEEAKSCPVPGLARGPWQEGAAGQTQNTHWGSYSMLDVFHQRSSLNVFKTIFNSTGHFHKDIIFCLPVYYLKTFQSMPLQSQTAITVISWP